MKLTTFTDYARECISNLILSDGTTQVKISVRRSPQVTYSLNGNDNDKK